MTAYNLILPNTYNMPRNRLQGVMKHYSPPGKRNHGRHLKRLLDTWDRNGSTSCPTPWQIYDDDDDDDNNDYDDDDDTYKKMHDVFRGRISVVEKKKA